MRNLSARPLRKQNYRHGKWNSPADTNYSHRTSAKHVFLIMLPSVCLQLCYRLLSSRALSSDARVKEFEQFNPSVCSSYTHAYVQACFIHSYGVPSLSHHHAPISLLPEQLGRRLEYILLCRIPCFRGMKTYRRSGKFWTRTGWPVPFAFTTRAEVSRGFSNVSG